MLVAMLWRKAAALANKDYNNFIKLKDLIDKNKIYLNASLAWYEVKFRLPENRDVSYYWSIMNKKPIVDMYGLLVVGNKSITLIQNQSDKLHEIENQNILLISPQWIGYQREMVGDRWFTLKFPSGFVYISAARGLHTKKIFRRISHQNI